MKFKIGDFVRFVDEPIEGHITSFLNNELLGVTDDTGFEIPVPQNKITLVHGNMRSIEDDEENELKPLEPLKFIDQGIFLGVAGEEKEGLAKFYLVNETSFELLIHVSIPSGNKNSSIFANLIPPREYQQIYTGNFSSVHKWPSLLFQILRSSTRPQQGLPAIERSIKIKPLELIRSKEQLAILPEKAWLYQLDKEEEDIGLDKLRSHFISHRPKKK
ncbi:MAG: hypothetical protein ACTHZ1_04595 [Sphingobacterium sp.]